MTLRHNKHIEYITYSIKTRVWKLSQRWPRIDRGQCTWQKSQKLYRSWITGQSVVKLHPLFVSHTTSGLGQKWRNIISAVLSGITDIIKIIFRQTFSKTLIISAWCYYTQVMITSWSFIHNSLTAVWIYQRTTFRRQPVQSTATYTLIINTFYSIKDNDITPGAHTFIS